MGSEVITRTKCDVCGEVAERPSEGVLPPEKWAELTLTTRGGSSGWTNSSRLAKTLWSRLYPQGQEFIGGSQMNREERIKEILSQFRKSDEIDATSYQAGINADRNLDEAAKAIRAFDTVECPVCKGNGWVLDLYQKKYDCPTCRGTGRVFAKPVVRLRKLTDVETFNLGFATAYKLTSESSELIAYEEGVNDGAKKQREVIQSDNPHVRFKEE